MGPQHPSTHGVFRMVLTVDGEVIVDVEPVIGYMHRGGEKLLETLDYRQGIGIMDRTDYLGNFNGEQVYCMAAEKLYGFEVPERAEYLRVICTELNRVASHMMFLGAYGTDAGVFGTTFTYGFIERERIQRIFERLTGERMMYNYFRVGGVAWEPYEGFRARIRDVIPQLRQGIADFNGLLTTNEVFLARTRNIGVITPERAIDYGLTGPMLRASGVSLRHPQGRAVLDLRPLRLRGARRHDRRLLRPISRAAGGDASSRCGSSSRRWTRCPKAAR